MDARPFPIRKQSFNSPAENIGSLVFGRDYIPSPRNGESVYDSMLRNNRSLDLADLQSSSIVGNPMLQRIGLPDNPATRQIGRLVSMFSPQSFEYMSPILGGNPAQAVKNVMAKSAGWEALNAVAPYLPVAGSLLGLGAGYGGGRLLSKLDARMLPKLSPLQTRQTLEMKNALGLRGKVRVDKPVLSEAPKGVQENAFYLPHENRIEATSMKTYKPGLIGHELGHAHIEHNPGPVRWLQRNLINVTDKYAPYSASLLGALAGVASHHDPAAAALMGALGGGLINSGTLIPEFEASRRGIKAVMKTSLPFKEKIKNSLSMLPGFMSYFNNSVIPGAVSGAISGM